MEKFLLGGFLTGDKLNIIHQEQIRFPVFGAEFDIFTVFNGVNQLVGELVALDVDNVGVGIFLADAVGNGVQQMGLANAGRAIEKQRVVHLTRGLADGNGSGMGKPVGGAHHKIVKGKLGVKIHRRGRSTLIFPGGQLFVAEHQQLGVGIENLFQGVMDVVGAAAADDLPAEVRGGIENQIVLIQLHHLGIVEPGRHGNGAQAFFHMAQHLGPDVGG